MQTDRNSTEAVNLSKSMYQNPVVFTYRFQNSIPDAPVRSSSKTDQNVDFIQDINARILKRVVLMSKHKVDYIYDNLELERRRK